MGFLDTVGKAKAFDKAQGAQQMQHAQDAELLGALKTQKMAQDKAAQEAEIYKTGALDAVGGLARQAAGPSVNADQNPNMKPPEGTNVTNEEIAALKSMGVETPTMEDVMFLRKQSSLEALQGGMGAASDMPVGLAGQYGKAY